MTSPSSWPGRLMAQRSGSPPARCLLRVGAPGAPTFARQRFRMVYHVGRTVPAYLLPLAGAGRVIFGGSLAGNVSSSCLCNSSSSSRLSRCSRVSISLVTSNLSYLGEHSTSADMFSAARLNARLGEWMWCGYPLARSSSMTGTMVLCRLVRAPACCKARFELVETSVKTALLVPTSSGL